jgi:hypothetical protein
MSNHSRSSGVDVDESAPLLVSGRVFQHSSKIHWFLAGHSFSPYVGMGELRSFDGRARGCACPNIHILLGGEK